MNAAFIAMIGKAKLLVQRNHNNRIKAENKGVKRR